MVDNKANTSVASYFLLLEFSEARDLQIVHFFVFLTLYLATVTGNVLIFFVIVFDHHLHAPMYLFLMNLAVIDIGSVSVTIPKSMLNSFSNTRLISYSGCVAQVFFFFFFLASDFVLLIIMAHDRYVAICNPLRYETIMNRISCMQMVVSAWISGFLYGAIHTGSTFAISFCSNTVFLWNTPVTQTRLHWFILSWNRSSCLQHEYSFWLLHFHCSHLCENLHYSAENSHHAGKAEDVFHMPSPSHGSLHVHFQWGLGLYYTYGKFSIRSVFDVWSYVLCGASHDESIDLQLEKQRDQDCSP